MCLHSGSTYNLPSLLSCSLPMMLYLCDRVIQSSGFHCNAYHLFTCYVTPPHRDPFPQPCILYKRGYLCCFSYLSLGANAGTGHRCLPLLPVLSSDMDQSTPLNGVNDPRPSFMSLGLSPAWRIAPLLLPQAFASGLPERNPACICNTKCPSSHPQSSIPVFESAERKPLPPPFPWRRIQASGAVTRNSGLMQGPLPRCAFAMCSTFCNYHSSRKQSIPKIKKGI